MKRYLKPAAAASILLLIATTASATADATCSISTPTPSTLVGDVLIPYAVSGQPCFTKIDQGQISNVDFDEAWALEERIMDGEILYLQAAECRWNITATCEAEASVTVSGRGSSTTPVTQPDNYRALAYQVCQVDIYDNSGSTPQIFDTLNVAPYPTLVYPETGTNTLSGQAYQLNYAETHEGYPKLRLKIMSQSGVLLESFRTEVTLSGYARQVPSEWGGQMEAWQIGGDDFIPIVITQQNGNEDPAIWAVR
jgi:hypothetical protein